MTMLRQLSALLALLLVCCTDETPPYWETRCVKSHLVNTSHMTTSGCGLDMISGQLKCGSRMIWVNETTNVCDKRDKVCVWGADYQGEKICK